MSQSEEMMKLAMLIGEWKAVSINLKDENTRLIAKNAELKRQLAEKVGCRCPITE